MINDFNFEWERTPLTHTWIITLTPLLYLLVLWILHRWMKTKAHGYKLTWLGFTHDSLLCLISFFTVVGLVVEV